MVFAGEGEDYTAASTITSFNRSSVINSIVEACISIIIMDDDMGEPFEQFTVVVEPHDPTERVTVINGRISIIIQDNESKFNQYLYDDNNYGRFHWNIYFCMCVKFSWQLQTFKWLMMTYMHITHT